MREERSKTIGKNEEKILNVEKKSWQGCIRRKGKSVNIEKGTTEYFRISKIAKTSAFLIIKLENNYANFT